MTPFSPVIQTGSDHVGLVGLLAVKTAVDIHEYLFIESVFGDSYHPSGNIILFEFISQLPPDGLFGTTVRDVVAVNAKIVLSEEIDFPSLPSFE